MPETATIIVDKTQENIINAALQHFGIDTETLITGTTHHIAYMRWCVFYLVKNNTRLTYDAIAQRLKKRPYAVRNGIENITAQHRHEAVVKKDIQNISKIAGILSE